MVHSGRYRRQEELSVDAITAISRYDYHVRVIDQDRRRPTSGLSADEQHAYDQRVFDGKTEGLTQDDVLDNTTLYWLPTPGLWGRKPWPILFRWQKRSSRTRDEEPR